MHIHIYICIYVFIRFLCPWIHGLACRVEARSQGSGSGAWSWMLKLWGWFDMYQGPPGDGRNCCQLSSGDLIATSAFIFASTKWLDSGELPVQIRDLKRQTGPSLKAGDCSHHAQQDTGGFPSSAESTCPCTHT